LKILGLDVGDKTIGVAISDALNLIAQPRFTIFRSTMKADLDEVIKLIIDEKIQRIVMGLPKNMNNTIGPQGEKVLAFNKNLSKKILYSKRLEGKEIEIVLWDERLTTVSAERTLIEADISRKKRKKLIDNVAASYILQSYLDYFNSKE
jgi:putative Holliday junction resolvase